MFFKTAFMFVVLGLPLSVLLTTTEVKKPAETVRFSLQNFTQKEDLDTELSEQLPFGSPIEDVDKLLVEEAGAVRTNNLIQSHRNADILTRGTSSHANFVYYFKPKADETNWSEASNGWVIKVKHGNFHQEGDSKFERITGGSGDGLLEINVLSTPADKDDNEHIQYVKKLLQYKEELEPTDNFDASQWQKLTQIHSKLPCDQGLSDDCLMNQVFTLLNIPDQPLRLSIHYSKLHEIIRDIGDAELAKTLLKIWLTEEDLRSQEANVHESRQMNEHGLDVHIRRFHMNYIQLLFIAEEYQKATDLLVQMQEKYKAGIDYGVLYALNEKGDYDQAFKIAQQTLEWQRTSPDPNLNSSAIMHCEGYLHNRAQSMGELGVAFVEQGNLERAYQLAKMLKQYWQNEAYGQQSFCYTNSARSGYSSVMLKLFEAYSDNGDRDQAKIVLDELVNFFQEQTQKFEYYNKGFFENLSIKAAEHNLKASLLDVAEIVREKSKGMEFPEVYRDTTNEPTSLIYALAGEYDKAINYLENFEPAKPEKDSFYDAEIFGTDPTPVEEIRLTSYLKIAKTLADIGDKHGALIFLEKTTSYLGVRNPEYDKALRNLDDYYKIAMIYLDLDEKEKSWEVTSKLMQIYADKTMSDFRNGAVTYGFFGRIAELYAHHQPIDVVLKWSEELPFYFSGYAYAGIGELLVEQKRWEELDLFMSEMAKALAVEKQPLANWERFATALIQAKKFEEYMGLLNMLDDVPKEDPKASKPKNQTYIRVIDQEEMEISRQQMWMIVQLLIADMSYQKIPEDVLKTAWSDYIHNCKGSTYYLENYDHGKRDPLIAKELMSACYLRLITTKNNFEKYQRYLQD